jgi:hypothetical protein
VEWDAAEADIPMEALRKRLNGNPGDRPKEKERFLNRMPLDAIDGKGVLI